MKPTSQSPRSPLSPSRRALAIVLAVFAVGALAGGCGGFKNATERLKITTQKFNENIRWQRFSTAAKSVVEPKRVTWTRAMELAGRTFRIQDYEITPIDLGDEVATMHVDLTYTQTPGVIIQHMRRKQTWKKVEGEWYLDGDVEVKFEEAPPVDKMPDFAASEDTSDV